MKSEAISKAMSLIKIHEGFKPKPYLDTKGILTIGYGRNLKVFPLSDEEKRSLDLNHQEYSEDLASDWLASRVEELYGNLSKFGWFNHLDSQRQAVLLDMAYNLGIKKLIGFKKMIQALKVHDYKLAAKEMRDSDWFIQVKHRALRLSGLMEKEDRDA
ncbi:hypothetical protein [Helicobacter sp. 13S00477-4]|uniref:glycoside hydrolase family protein n=1 Tax=Helicobacter sp. 13S00477-4 TaxID=1905759 RepID=UPI000BA6A926|nr:hypothetical protein [Helicobacter sp. 13S00477-4]PAF51286.1 hypothetical protein BKH44_06155 [Helicobacter sp. 13S00477-4]